MRDSRGSIQSLHSDLKDGKCRVQQIYRYREEILRPHALPYASAIANGSQLVDDNARHHRSHEANEFLDQNSSDRMQYGHKKVQIFNQSCKFPYERPHLQESDTSAHAGGSKANGCVRVAKLASVLYY